jgi:hypothetical protein
MVNKLDDIKINMGLSLSDVIAAVKKLKPAEKELFIDSLLAATSPDYLESIKEARQEYQSGNVHTMNEVFKKK